MSNTAAAVPEYLKDVYWWAYVHPNAVRVFERQWLVNLILFGNFARLRDAALAELGEELPGRTLQLACVYGDFTPRLVERVADGGSVDVVDVLPIQLSNLAKKLDAKAPVALVQKDASKLDFADGSYDRVILFFLLHEQPEDVRQRTLHEAWRVLKPGGKMVIVDYHEPSKRHPLKGFMRWLLRNFEPFAMDLWRREVREWLPRNQAIEVRKETFWGSLYQKLVIEKR